ncbi:hypothetical protein GJAV_G00104430 [Gymnothorax javanicus]|nr:hypothetical protein GJAV_G00104430 [Gymnothorax javanicus]
MSVRMAILLVYFLLGTSLAMRCREVPGSLKQIDAGVGQVFGVNKYDQIYTLYGETWTQLPGALKHVSVGPSGVWGTSRNNQIYKLVGADWVQVGGQLKQVDAGGDQFVAGVDLRDSVYCLGRDATVAFRGPGFPVPWKKIPGGFIYYSCGPYGCWGVNKNQDVFVRKWVTPTACKGKTRWQPIPGKVMMIEVGTEGSVYGVDAGGTVIRREGIIARNPAGTGWTHLKMCGQSKHVSYDLGHLWVITTDERILDCVI